MFSIGIIEKCCPTLRKDLSISIAGCQANGNIIRNVMETSDVLYPELALPRHRYTQVHFEVLTGVAGNSLCSPGIQECSFQH